MRHLTSLGAPNRPWRSARTGATQLGSTPLGPTRATEKSWCYVRRACSLAFPLEKPSCSSTCRMRHLTLPGAAMSWQAAAHFLFRSMKFLTRCNVSADACRTVRPSTE